MTIDTPQSGNDEVARLGHEAFERCVRPNLTPGERWQYVAIEVRTGDYEVATTSQEAISQVRARNPTGEVWIMRTDGSPAFRMRTVR